MKKVALSLASVLVATAFAPEASAIPAFARQTGMACKACHFQHFPLLNAFGRAFKSSGFTMMGAQGKVEGEHLSLPNVLNISALATAGYENVSKSQQNPTVAATTSSPATGGSDGAWFTPNGGGELSLFFGGRISENVGFLSELAFPDNAPATSSAKIPMLWEVGNGVRVGIVPMSNNSPAYSFETLNTGAHSAHRLMGKVGAAPIPTAVVAAAVAAVTATGIAPAPAGVGKGAHINTTSAAQYLGTSGAGANGVSFVVNGSWGFVNIGKYTLAAVGQQPSNGMNMTYARGVYTFDAMGWDAGVGIQNFSGTDSNPNTGLGMETRVTIVDGQMQGEVGGMPLGIYASYGTAPHSITRTNLFNGYSGVVGGDSKRSFNLAGELGVIPNKATLQLAFRSAKDGSAALNALAGLGDRDNAIMIGATYELAQNVEVSLAHTNNTGSAWNTTVTGIEPIGRNTTTLLLEALF